MEKIRSGNDDNIAFVYTETRISDTEIMYIVDREPEGTDTYSPPGSTELLTVTRLAAYETRAPSVGDFVTTDWGTYIGAYAPITDPSTGEFLGLVGVEVSKEQYDEIIHYELVTIIGSISIVILMAAVFLFLSSTKIQNLVVRDALTGIYNRNYFLRCLKTHMKEARKRNTPVTVFMADLDHFKAVNDTYGHPFGDVVLESMCHTMSGVLRKTDCLARYGGEEFIGVLPGLSRNRR